jgi:TATA-box binding protein (TBP) (component of TFIID and TFIIIB)
MSYPEFEKIEVSTKTIIAVTNWNLEIKKLFNILPITDYVLIPKRRGRKRKEEVPNPNAGIKEGSIVTIKYQNDIRGVELKGKKSDKSAGYFRNSVTIVMYIDGKMINFKISKNGKFQITGCKYDYQAEKCITYLWDYVKDTGLCKCENDAEVTFITVMTNIDFNLGFSVNREVLDENINTLTDYNSLLETSFGYTGVNIKIPMPSPNDIPLKKITYRDGQWIRSEILYKDYIETLEEKDRKKESTKVRYNTILAFQSGNIILSSMHVKTMQKTYEYFIDMIKQWRENVEEKIF